MQCLILVALVASSCMLASSAFVWHDCATAAQTALTVHSFKLSPIPITFPGPIHVDLNLTINRQIDHLFVDVELNRKTLFGNVKIPCIQGTNIGSCQNIDACSILPDILNGTSVVSADLGRQIEAILLSALGHNPHCPILPEKVLLTHETLQLKAIPGALGTVTDGNYHIQIIIKDDPTSSDNVGCLEFDAGIKRHHTGFLFN